MEVTYNDTAEYFSFFELFCYYFMVADFIQICFRKLFPINICYFYRGLNTYNLLYIQCGHKLGISGPLRIFHVKLETIMLEERN